MRTEFRISTPFFNCNETRMIPEFNDGSNVRLSPSKKINCFVCFNENPLKMVKNAFYIILKVLFVLKILELLS